LADLPAAQPAARGAARRWPYWCPLGPPPAGGRTEPGQPLGGAVALVLVGLAHRVAQRLPALPGEGHRLLRSGIILAPHRDPRRRRCPVRLRGSAPVSLRLRSGHLHSPAPALPQSRAGGTPAARALLL